MLDTNFQSNDYLETLEYANILLYWLTSNIEDDKKRPDNTKKKLLFNITELKARLDKATSANDATEFLKNIKSYIIEINALFYVDDKDSNELVRILLEALRTRFNNLSLEHDYKAVFELSQNNIDDAVYKLIDDFSDNTWGVYKRDKIISQAYADALCTPAILLSYASWITQNITTGLFLQSSLVFLSLCNPTTATIIGFSLSFSLLASNFDLIYKNLSYFVLNAGLSKGWDNFFYNPFMTLKNLALMACSIAAASTIVCFAGTMPTTLPYLNLILGVTSAISCSIFFYQDLSHLLSIEDISNRLYRLYEVLFIEPFKDDNIWLNISKFTLNLFITVSGFSLFYYTGKTIFESSKDVLLHHYALNIFNISTYVQNLFLSCSILGLASIAASNIFLMFTSIKHYLEDLQAHYMQRQEESLSYEELTTFYNSKKIEKSSQSADEVATSSSPTLDTSISSTQIKESITNNLKMFENGFYCQLFGYSINNRFVYFVANNIKPEDNKNANSISRGLIGHMEPQSGILFIDLAKMFIEKIFESGPIEHGLFDKLRFRN